MKREINARVCFGQCEQLQAVFTPKQTKLSHTKANVTKVTAVNCYNSKLLYFHKTNPVLSILFTWKTYSFYDDPLGLFKIFVF